MTLLMRSKVLSIGPLEVGGAAGGDAGLKAGVAPSGETEQSHQATDQTLDVSRRKIHRVPPSFWPASLVRRLRRSLEAAGGLSTNQRRVSAS